MILLNGHTLARKNYVRPEAMSLTLEEKNSTATLTLGPDAPEISINDWLQDDTEPGKGIVWRVKTINESVETQTRTVTLEHVIQHLKDRVLFGETKPGNITGNAADTSCSARAAINYALARQGEWKLGDTAENPTNPYSFNGETLLAALETITSSMADVQWEYDLSSVPFTLHIRKQPTGFQSEMRMSRNITTMRRQIDRSRMYTRIYPIGKDNLHISGEYLSKNEKTWGIVCKVETDQSKETDGALRAWAQERLNRHCEPLVTVTISGLDMSRATGEALDKIVLGKRCRVPLPDKGITITERVTKMAWSDKIKEPEKFTVTLANNTEDVATIVNRIQEAAASGKGGGGRYGAKKNEEDHAWFVDTTEKVGMVAEAVAGPGADKDWSRVSSIFVDGEGIHQKVTKAEKEIVKAETRIEANEDAIRLEAEKRIAEDKSLLGKIQVEAGKVGMVVGTQNGKNFIKAGEICVAINKDGSSTATIEASKIHLLGETIAKTITAEYISSQIAKLTILTTKRLHVTGSADFDGGIRAKGYGYGNNEDVLDCFVSVTKEESGGNITLKFGRANGKAARTVTFNKATTLSGAWSSGKYTVTASPQGNTISTFVEGGSESWSGGVATIPIRYTSNGGQSYYPTGASCYAHVYKSDISASRGNRSASAMSCDATLTSITQNGYYLITVSVHGVSKTYRIYANVS